MKASNLSFKSDVFRTVAGGRRENKTHAPRQIARFGGILILVALLAGSLYLSAGVSASRNTISKQEEALIESKMALPIVAEVNASFGSSVLTKIAPMFTPQA